MSTPSASPPKYTGKTGFVVLAIGMAVLGVGLYIAQVVQAHRLFTPWYLPICGTLAVLFMLLALWGRVTVTRVLLFVLILLLAAGEWFMVGGSLPAYTGPVEVGKPFPAFTTTRADGTQMTQADLRGDRDTVMVFFRGRW
jgi:hypothetical protein